MKRTLPQILGVIAIAALLNANVMAIPPVQTPLNTPTSPLPFVIAVVSDHYTDQGRFNIDVDNFIKYGLLAHPYFSQHAGELQIVSFYDPLVAAKSNYGFDVDVPSQNCLLSWSDAAGSDATLSKLLVVANNNPDHIIVIGDHPYNFGCTSGKWSYVGRDAAGPDVLPHEMGHALGHLLDEWFFDANIGVSHPGIPDNMTRNCFDPRAPGTTPPWLAPSSLVKFPGAGSFAGCDFFELDAVHAYDRLHNGHKYCLMGATSGAEFCPVCHDYMEEAFGIRHPDLANPDAENPDITNPGVRLPKVPPNERAKKKPGPPPPPERLRIVKTAFVQQPTPGTVKPLPGPQPAAGATTPVPPRPILQLVVSFDPSTGKIVAKKGFPISARYVPEHRRVGEWVYEIVDLTRKPQDQVVDVGVFPSNLFRSNSYQGGVAHQASAPHETDVTIQIPDIPADYVKTGSPELLIKIYRLLPSVTERFITPAVLAKLKLSGGAVATGEPITTKHLMSVM